MFFRGFRDDVVGFLVWSLNCADPLCAKKWLERKTLTELYRGAQKMQIKRL